MKKERLAIQICGFGGQGVILASVIFGTAAVTEKGFFAVQTQSFGSEARGGECQAELVLSTKSIYSPIVDRVNILIGMSNAAFQRYIPRVKKNGIVLIDSDYVQRPEREDLTIYEIPANRIATELGFSLSTNMVFLGALQHITQIIDEKDLAASLKVNTSARFMEANLAALQKGAQYFHSLEQSGEDNASL